MIGPFSVRYFHVPPYLSRKRIGSFLGFSLKKLGFRRGRLHVVFMEHLKDMNRRYFGKNRDTNVIVFPWKEKKYFPGGDFLGEIYLGLKQIARDKRLGTEAAALFLLGHALLHLKGYGDGSEKENIAMHRKNNALLEKWKRNIS